MQTTLLVAASLWLWIGPAEAQDIGDPAAGHVVASKVCAECHVVEPVEGAVPAPGSLPFKELKPLPFQQIANTSGVTAIALSAWLTTSHPTMPNIALSQKERRDVVAYILTLKDEASGGGP